ncbi:hypothetical protein B0H14DRAFT_2590686 [Mycena olivaceomarginata]|nr:hypothetical protein B0H14DRAFT_2590686 [Mycena olivaceomarginata]
MSWSKVPDLFKREDGTPSACCGAGPATLRVKPDLTLVVTYTKGTVMDSEKTPATRSFLETGSSQIWIECNSATIKSFFWFSESLSIEGIFLIQPFLTSGSNSMYST